MKRFSERRSQLRYYLQKLRQESTARPSLRRASRIYSILHAAWKKFLIDDCLNRANAIAYSLLMSIIPLLTVLVKYAEVDRETIRANLARFMAAYGIMDATEVLQILDEILSRANTIAGAAGLFMVFTAANILRHMEDSFNKIFRARKARPLLYRFSIYIASIVFLPATLILSTGGFQYSLNKFKPPDLVSVAGDASEQWVLGTDGILRHYSESGLVLLDLEKKIDRSAPFRSIYVDYHSGETGSAWEILKGNIPPEDLSPGDFVKLQKVTSAGERVFVIARNGKLFYSGNRGENWNHYSIIFKIDTEIREAYLEDMILLPDGRLALLAALGSFSCFLTFHEERLEMTALDSVYSRLTYFATGREDTIHPDGLYLLGNARYLYSPDLGRTWLGPFEERFGSRLARLQVMTDDGLGHVVFGGTDSALWIHRDGRLYYPALSAPPKSIIQQVHIENDGSGFLLGSGDLLRFTFDHGLTWHRPTREGITHPLYAALPAGNRIYLAGQDESLYAIESVERANQVDDFGRSLVELRIESVSRFPGLKAFLLKGALYTTFYLFILFIFFTLYKFLPHARVSIGAAFYGSMITSATLIVFYSVFQTWVMGFSSTGYIWGVWAIVPVGMIVILTSTQIILFGLEVAYVVQHPYLFRYGISEDSDDPEKYLLWNSLSLLTRIYSSVYEENKPLTNQAALEIFGNNASRLDHTREKLLEKRLFSYDHDTEEYFPSRPPGDISFRDVYVALFEKALSIPRDSSPNRFRSRLLRIQQRLLAALDGRAETTIEDLLHRDEENAKGN